MSKTKGSLNKAGSQPTGKPDTQLAGKYFNLFWIAVSAAVIVLVVRNIGVFGNLLKVVVGFGAVVIVHEFGHFIVAKLSGIKVEAFSIFMPPTLLGIRKTKEGFRFRFLPKIFATEDTESTENINKKLEKSETKKINSADEKTVEDEETEYRIGLIPFGGFVKMLGQDDTGPANKSKDPRSFANKPVGVRMGVITAGVVFNILSAILIFMIVFLAGIKLPPAMIGAVRPDSPAEQAGLRPGDEVIEIAGKTKNLDFSDISLAAALSDANEAVPMKVIRKERREDGSIEESIKEFAIVARQLPDIPIKAFGLFQPISLTIAEVSEPNKLYLKTGLRPGDIIKGVNGKEVQNHWELAEIVENCYEPEVTLLAERTDETGKQMLVASRIGLETYSPGTGQIYSIVPRLRMENIEVEKSLGMKIVAKVRQLLEKTGIIEKVKPKQFLQSGDIILRVGDSACPTPDEFREVVGQYADKELPINVLRTDANGVEKPLVINIRPKQQANAEKATIGISYLPMFDIQHAVVAKTLDTEGGPEKLEIPRGAKITAVDGVGVSNFYDVIREIQSHPGERITLDWRLDANVAGDAALNVDSSENSITVKSDFADFVPFERLERLYQASGPIDAIGMGCRKTVMFITQTYLTLKRLFAGAVSPKNLIGPVGIIAMSYQVVAHQPLIYYLYLLGLISAVIAVFNFLPLPPLDGGLIVLMLVERIKGSALSVRTQGIIAYTGWVLIGTLFLYVTFNDIVRVIFG